jgi:hypothetical protein
MGLVISADRFTFIWLFDDTLGSPTWAAGLVVGSGVVTLPVAVGMALVPALVGAHRVMHAVVVMTIGANVAMIVGPLLVDGVIDARGVAGAFAVQAVCCAWAAA